MGGRLLRAVLERFDLVAVSPCLRESLISPVGRPLCERTVTDPGEAHQENRPQDLLHFSVRQLKASETRSTGRANRFAGLFSWGGPRRFERSGRTPAPRAGAGRTGECRRAGSSR